MATPTRADRLSALLVVISGLVKRAIPLASRGVRAMGRGLRATAIGAYTHRQGLFAVGQRVAWWSALVLLFVGGETVLGDGALPGRTAMLAPFAVGLALCALVRLLTPARHLATAALGLGALHGVAIVMVWTALSG